MIALLLATATALVAALAALVLAAMVAAPSGMGAAELLRVYPELVRLLVNLSKDSRVARPVRWRLLLALVYNAQPINLIPDFIPVIGLADNIAITAWAVRSAIRRSGSQVVAANWRGSEVGLALLYRVCRLKAPPELRPAAVQRPSVQSSRKLRPGPGRADQDARNDPQPAACPGAQTDDNL